ncbi:hypothetical protein SSS_00426 [Sarcoptes scabiei]|uniref:Uncharacterized protein n=1 Tax=Sarcoptes scabiei TaxID=52283 RepID=A0A132AJR5_SARSC|nr:hypothetical protein SSS_00426 [Sarcoptes scabiei]KPM11226.1 hypothetical protein QR98_0097960 [Sarcoptes scabiei]
MSKFCSRKMGKRNSSSPYVGFSSFHTNGLNHHHQSFRRLSSASAISRSSSASTKNLLVKIDPNKCLSVSTILAPPQSNQNGTNNADVSDSLSPCYNCRIYKEVYSPSARCKSCRNSLLSVNADSSIDLSGLASIDHKNTSSLIDFDSLMLMVGRRGSHNSNVSSNKIGSTDRLSTSSSIDSNTQHHKSLMLLEPTYKHKPIRRSEEVGVPPHLRAPYRDSQPFWMK